MTHVIISGCIGPRGDGYRVDNEMTAEEAQRYHEPQVATFADTAADLVSALTLTYAAEAVGVARAARDAGIPSVISFTVETDGRLPSGQSLREAIEEVDDQTQGAVAYFMINCAHPTHFAHVLERTVTGVAASVVSAPTRPRRATPSSMKPKSWTQGIQPRSPAITASCRQGCRASRSSEGAAAPIIGMSQKSAPPWRASRSGFVARSGQGEQLLAGLDHSGVVPEGLGDALLRARTGLQDLHMPLCSQM